MGAIGAEDLMNWEKLQGAGDGKEEKILVLVRLRPLSEKEIARSEVADWECINPTTILYRNSLQERSGLPTAYSFGKLYISCQLYLDWSIFQLKMNYEFSRVMF